MFWRCMYFACVDVLGVFPIHTFSTWTFVILFPLKQFSLYEMISISPSLDFLSNVAVFQFRLRLVFVFRSWLDMQPLQEFVRHVISFWFQVLCWQKSLCHRGFYSLVYRQLSTNFTFVTTILFTHNTFLWAKCSLMCLSRLWYTLILTAVRVVYLNLNMGLTASVIGWQGCLLS
jgi:hypothetical protein